MKAQDIILGEGPSKEKAMRKVKQALATLRKFEKEIAGLSLFHNLNPGVLWNGDKEILTKLKRFPDQRKELIKQYNLANKKWSNAE